MTVEEPLPLPERLRALHRRWVADRTPPQPGSRWSRRVWRTTLPQYKDLFVALPDRVDRKTVEQHFARVRDDPDAAVQGFIVAMIWGYGPVGYGAFRTARILAENQDVGERLKTVARRVWEDGGCAAFEWLKQHRISWLGVAFATKYLFFSSPRSSSAEPALVLDRRVQRWLARHAGWRPRLGWYVCDYCRYVRSVAAWAGELGARPDELEYLIFSDKDDELLLVAGDDEAGLLEAIEQLSDTFAEVADGWPADDAEDFEHALRQLRRIALLRRADRGGEEAR